jgi:hypothetical protein
MTLKTTENRKDPEIDPFRLYQHPSQDSRDGAQVTARLHPAMMEVRATPARTTVGHLLGVDSWHHQTKGTSRLCVAAYEW